ncbi:1-acyl-sn-glycerol-3-phosphate acyltransferase [Rhodohalobacter sp. SW132]|uniref:lysophospholipid acyltransferase family protein n=1 Tax=Rhodohalobacter sp. SW132 TaxID=2293433 RepID=UPI000E2459DA|nr:lysophospholipid acyltransferase family protein [Rhodohalobacter sp. SW132]REL38964.1 1-acyl-sn-glycerol-3-phosphate acyltransferase [Rhodohalobacter sp. SW132]
MRKVIAYLKLGTLTVFTLIFWSIYMIVLGLIKLTPFRYERWRNFFMRNWSRAAALIFNIRVKAEGKPPKAPFFIVCNHMGYLDIIPLYLQLRCTFVAKKEVRSWPILGKMVDSVGVIFVDRNRRTDVKRVNELITNSLNEFQGLIVFPEGTSTGGYEVKDFHASLLQYPAATNRPVYAASLHYETAPKDPPAVDSVCFFGGRESFGSHVVKFAQNRRTDCTIRFREETIQSDDRKELAVKLHDAVAEIFTPTSVKPEQEIAEVGE